MELRPELEPKFDIVEQLYSKILDKILKYADFLDKNGDEDGAEYKKVEVKLHNLTNKDISKFNFSEYWEEEGIEVLAFRIALPDPLKVEHITKGEVTEIVKRLKMFDEPIEGLGTQETIKGQFIYYLDAYYHNLLKLNFPKYDYKYFIRNKNKNGQYFEYTVDEIVGRLTPSV